MTKEDITSECRRCKSCSTFFLPIEGDPNPEYCDTCGPLIDEAQKQAEWHEKLVEGDL